MSDLIDRNLIAELVDSHGNVHWEDIAGLPSEQPDVRTQMSSADCISRQAAIEAFDCTNELIVSGEANARNVVNYINKVVGKIKDLPSAQPEQQWIPCSERTPKEEDEYICTMEDGQVQECGFVPRSVNYKMTGWSTCEAYGFKWLRDEEILAWMPLPEPYREEDRK